MHKLTVLALLSFTLVALVAGCDELARTDCATTYTSCRSSYNPSLSTEDQKNYCACFYAYIQCTTTACPVRLGQSLYDIASYESDYLYNCKYDSMNTDCNEQKTGRVATLSGDVHVTLLGSTSSSTCTLAEYAAVYSSETMAVVVSAFHDASWINADSTALVHVRVYTGGAVFASSPRMDFDVINFSTGITISYNEVVNTCTGEAVYVDKYTDYLNVYIHGLDGNNVAGEAVTNSCPTSETWALNHPECSGIDSPWKEFCNYDLDATNNFIFVDMAEAAADYYNTHNKKDKSYVGLIVGLVAAFVVLVVLACFCRQQSAKRLRKMQMARANAMVQPAVVTPMQPVAIAPAGYSMAPVAYAPAQAYGQQPQYAPQYAQQQQQQAYYGQAQPGYYPATPSAPAYTAQAQQPVGYGQDNYAPPPAYSANY